MAESKIEIYDLIPQKYYPKTVFIKENDDFDNVVATFHNSNIQYPFIAKPDIGLRGSAVKKVHTLEELIHYNLNANFDYLIQELIPYENEVGIFYVRFPNEKTGKITGIVSKEFLAVTGNGVSTVEELIKANPRFALQFKALKKEYCKKLLDVPLIGQVLNLVPYGNHARGAKFIDGSKWITAELTQTINDLCMQIDGFYYGRLDIMYHSITELSKGNQFLVVEINGAGSEPTHIYDPKHSLLFAWKELARHITYMYHISVANHKNGTPYLSHKEGMAEYRKHLEQSNKILNF